MSVIHADVLNMLTTYLRYYLGILQEHLSRSHTENCCRRLSPLLLHSRGASRSGAKPPVLLHWWESMLSHDALSRRLLYYLLLLFRYHLPGAVADEGLAMPAAVQALNRYRKLHL